MTDFDPYFRSLVLWMSGTAAAVFAGKALARFVSPALGGLVRGRFRVPIGFELFLIGMATLLVVMEPVHMANGLTVDGVLSRWRAYLPLTAVAALVAAFLSALLDGTRPVRCGLALAWPSALYAAMAWVFYLWLRSFIPPADLPMAAELEGYATPFLTLVTAYPAAAIVAGVSGAIGGRLARS
jgi:hypothetical protein